MPIINKGIFDTGDAFLRQTGNDWPTAQIISTADVIESSSNLYFSNVRVVQVVAPLLTTANVLETTNQYFTNAKVINAVTIGTVPGDISVSGNLIANGLIIRNISVSDSVLVGSTSANTIIADSVTSNIWGGLYTANVVETSGNLYFTTDRARSSFAAGQGIAISANGVISSKGDDTGLGSFNSGINLANALLVSNNFANLVTFDAGDGANFIVYSLHLTNYSNQTAYVTGRYVSAANTILFANLMEMPGPSFVEMQIKPQTYKPGDQLQLQSFSSPTQPANNLVSALISYQGSADVNFDRTANILTDNNPANIFTTVNRTSIIESIKVVNPNPTNVPVSVWFADSSYNLFAYVAANVIVPSFSSIELCDYPKAMRDNFTLRAQKFGAVDDKISVFLSTKYTSQYTVTPSTETVSEGSTVTFNIDTLNVGNGTTLYYTLSFYSNSLFANDFVSNVSGSTIVTNDSAVIQITANADNYSFTEGDETFRLQLRKNSIAGTILAESANVVIKNTSNTQLIAANISSTSPGIVLEGSNIVISINTTNYGESTALYYSTTGNVISSDFVQGNTGTVLITNNSANLTLTAGSLASGTKSFVLELRRDSVTGTPVYVSSNILIVDSTLAYSSATGGVQSNVVYPEGNFRIHAFITSGTFTVNSVGSVYPNVEYLVVAGGGGNGGSSAPGEPYKVGGGGGGGGLLTGNVTLTTATSYAMVVGAGGSVQGSNSSIFSNAIITIGGGSGGSHNTLSANPYPSPEAHGKAGGSGGGGGGWNGTPQGTNGTGGAAMASGSQGYAGRNNGGAGGYVAGGGGAGGTVSTAPSPANGTWAKGMNGRIIPWVPSSYGSNATGVPGMSGSGQAFAGGGAGGWCGASAPQITPAINAGHMGGGAGGGGSSYSAFPGAGNVNTGGGGANNGLAGGSGIVIVRYRTA